jgi:hypothetical protein
MPKPASRRADHYRPLSSTKPAEGSKLRFLGSPGALQDFVLLTGVYGEWQEGANGVWRYVCEDRAGLNWSSTKGTIWFDGPEQPRVRLKRIIEAALRNRITGVWGKGPGLYPASIG